MNGRNPLFVDRVDAGRALARRLEAYRGSGALVLGITRGGVVLAAEIARELGLDLDAAVARKLGAPGRQELAIGAVTADGDRYIDRELVAALGISELYVEAAVTKQLEVARARERFLHENRPPVPTTGRTVIVVDDGLATGATARAVCQSVRRGHPARLVVAAPVGSSDTCARLRTVADEVVCPYELDDLFAIGYHYLNFAPVEDDTVKALLEEKAPAR